ncbi:TOG array regulator of axonemal microtubules protein 2-like [Ammospiza nelsoni]|uniref:TOG array regulator of axonemal microtubules protein 2-like n=1 Tax=Ammospiza nelsoni TaxID=2857394 RepID=UPI00286AB78F|nr:TOG array regulator of axonemal microtubules protein 2-like [Ammospiza nelsoni]
MAGAVPGAAAPMADPLLTVTPQTATGAKRREEPLRGRGQKDGAFSDPQQSLQEALSMLDSDDWELKKKGLLNIPRLAESHPEVLLCRLREICLAATSEVTNLRSKVSCSAIVTLGELFAILKKDMDSEADEVAAVLLPMVWNSPEFIQKAACQSLGMMVENVTPARAMTVLMDRGVKSRYVQVRKCAAELLLSLMEKMGVTKLAGTPRAERLPHVAGRLAQDCHKDTSYSTVQCQEMENQQGECSSVKEPVKKRNDGSKEPQASLPSSIWVKSAPGGRLLHRPKAQVTLPATVEGRESLQKLYHLLEAKGFQARMEGVALLLDLCKTSPQLISSNIVQIFDHFVLRINDTHKKVKQQALEVLAEMIGVLEDALNPVMVRLVEGIRKNLNSKDPGVHAAAVTALDQSVVHLDEVSLMKELSHQWSKLSGEALLEVTECITVLVEWVHARSPEVVQRYALPVLWSCLENKALPVRSANVCAVVTKLACALCEVMGTQLIKCAESKPPHSWHGGLKELQTEGKVKTNHGSASEKDQEEAAD